MKYISKKNHIIKPASVILALLFAATVMPYQVYAEPTVTIDENLEVEDPAKINDDTALSDVNEERKSSELADPQLASGYLLSNAQEMTIKQIPTDEHDTSLPEKFDLRDRGVVTPVKLQNPWGTCWGFAAIAASETSILSEMGETYEDTGLDLSEHHLTYFSRTFLQDGSAQDGEGVHMFNESDTLNTGGYEFTACSVFSNGIGPVDEDLIPYRGKESKTENWLLFNLDYSEEDDWSLPKKYEFIQTYDLQESNILPSPAVYDFNPGDDENDMDVREEAYVGYDAQATDIMKRELLEGRAISVAFCADEFMPGQSSSEGLPMYMNTDDNKWTHYTFDGGVANHAVTIVGWDDSIKSTDFLDHTDDMYGDGLAHQPEGDGAWIVKNSWGSEESSFPNNGAWGIENEDGISTGYFYISYYDRSLLWPETFRFDVTDYENDTYMIDQYDYLQTDMTQGWADKNGLQMANVFTAEADASITEVSCQTNSENISTTYQIYLLDDGAVTPDDGKLAATISKDYAHSGYHKERLEEPVAVGKGQRYSVVVTSCFTDGDTLYYEFCDSVCDNKEAVEEYNRKVLYRHRGEPLSDDMTPEEAYADELMSFYSVGIVNEGESFVYMDELGQWADLGLVVPYLQEDEEYEGMDFDNFPVKAYLEYTGDGPQELDESEEEMEEELDFAEPAGEIYMPFIYMCLGILIGVLLLIILIVLFIVLHFARKQRTDNAPDGRQPEYQDAVTSSDEENEGDEGSNIPE